MQNAIFPALFIVNNELDGDSRATRPIGLRRIPPITHHVTRVVFSHCRSLFTRGSSHKNRKDNDLHGFDCQTSDRAKFRSDCQITSAPMLLLVVPPTPESQMLPMDAAVFSHLMVGSCGRMKKGVSSGWRGKFGSILEIVINLLLANPKLYFVGRHYHVGDLGDRQRPGIHKNIIVMRIIHITVVLLLDEFCSLYVGFFTIFSASRWAIWFRSANILIRSSKGATTRTRSACSSNNMN